MKWIGGRAEQAGGRVGAGHTGGGCAATSEKNLVQQQQGEEGDVHTTPAQHQSLGTIVHASTDPTAPHARTSGHAPGGK